MNDHDKVNQVYNLVSQIGDQEHSPAVVAEIEDTLPTGSTRQGTQFGERRGCVTILTDVLTLDELRARIDRLEAHYDDDTEIAPRVGSCLTLRRVMPVGMSDSIPR